MSLSPESYAYWGKHTKSVKFYIWLQKQPQIIPSLFPISKDISSKRWILVVSWRKWGRNPFGYIVKFWLSIHLFPKGNLEDNNAQRCFMKNSSKSDNFGNMLNLLSWNSHTDILKDLRSSTVKKETYLIQRLPSIVHGMIFPPHIIPVTILQN